jgi:Do/DeqQ family serine protease
MNYPCRKRLLKKPIKKKPKTPNNFFIGILEFAAAKDYFGGMRFFILLLFLSFATPAQASSQVPSSSEDIRLSFAPLVKKVAPSVVNIYTKRVVETRTFNPLANDPFFGPLLERQFGFGVPRQRLESSLGSGVIVDPAGLAVTNAHVIKGAREITVMLSDGREFPASITLNDPASDLALLQLQTNGQTVPFATLRPSEQLEVGDLVLAIGNPFGVGQTVTSGIVSALARSSLNINDFNFFIQTDAAINPGNSGGPLVAMDGGVVGINSAIYSRDGGSLGIGFSIPSEMVATILAAAKTGRVTKDGSVIRPWVGLTAQDVTSSIANSLGLSSVSGALIANLHPLSPAREAGLRTSDVVTAVDGRKIRDASELRFRLAMIPIGGQANLNIIRQGKPDTVTMKAIAPPNTPARDEILVTGENPLSGAKLANINPALATELGLKNEDEGVVVTALAPRSVASRLVTVGDVIVAINRQKISKTKEVQKLLNAVTRPGWILTIRSNGRERNIVIQ